MVAIDAKCSHCRCPSYWVTCTPACSIVDSCRHGMLLLLPLALTCLLANAAMPICADCMTYSTGGVLWLTAGPSCCPAWHMHHSSAPGPYTHQLEITHALQQQECSTSRAHAREAPQTTAEAATLCSQRSCPQISHVLFYPTVHLSSCLL